MNAEVECTTVPATSATWFERLAAKLVFARLGSYRGGAIDVETPDGVVHELGDRSASVVRLEVRRWSFFRRVLLGGDIGFGEAYVEGDTEVDDLPELCRRFVRELGAIEARTPGQRLSDGIVNFLRRNTIHGSRRNIQSHYDLGNELYEAFLDPTMTYSCAVFEEESETLEQAQRRKIDEICRRLELAPGQEVLEIGCGWGSFAIHAASHYGCRVTCLTLSERQRELALERAAAAGVGDAIDVRLCDYRHVTGSFDRIVSIEMLEAVGHEFLGKFFEVCDRRLKPGGRIFLQTITFPDQDFDRYKGELDWIRKHIFPGGLLPSFFEMSKAIKRHTNLRVTWSRDIGPHYAPTLRQWRETFTERTRDIQAVGFDERFARMWTYYLATCEAAFETRYIANLQLILEPRFASSN